MAKKYRVGIVGGGQLAAMLGEGAKELGLEPVAIAGSSSDPGFRACTGSYLLQPGDTHAIHDFLATTEVVAFENEFFPDEIAKHSAEFSSKFRPSLDTIALLRDKLRQKPLLAKLGIATVPHQEMASAANPADWARSMIQEFGGACVFKLAMGGYDGKGVLIADRGSESQAAEFCAQGRAKGVGVYAEKKIAFRRELAIVAVKSTDGFFTNYPLVISEQQHGICKLVTGPATRLGVANRLESDAVMAAGKIAAASGYVGAFGVEFFEDENGKLLVNEIAPRVHNSGHYTQDAAVVSQFENHWQAILGVSLGDTTITAGAFAMLNLLGPDKEVAEVIPFSLKVPSGVSYHDYGKRQSRPGRKMGHLNGVVENVEALPALVESLKRLEQEWLAQMNKQG